MKPHSIIRLLSAIIMIGLALAFARPVMAASAPPAPTVLKLSPVRPQVVGDTFTVDATLKTASGDPIREGSIVFYANDDYLGRARLQDDGSANLQVRKGLKAGNYYNSRRIRRHTPVIPLWGRAEIVYQPSSIKGADRSLR